MKRLFGDDRGANVVEYALILAFVVVIAIAALVLVGTETNSLVDDPGLTGALL